ncbi:hypothetical protein HMPREF1867_01694, partial [Veillonella dispar]
AVVTPKTAVAAKIAANCFFIIQYLFLKLKQLLYNLVKQYAYPYVSMFPYK